MKQKKLTVSGWIDHSFIGDDDQINTYLIQLKECQSAWAEKHGNKKKLGLTIKIQPV
jgi:hypothetical protein